MGGRSLRFAAVVALWAVSQSALAQCGLQRFVEDGGFEEGLGRCVGLNDRFLVLGCPGDDIDQDATGSVYAFEKVNGAWDFRQKLFVRGWGFGGSLALDGDRLLVGAPTDDGKVPASGAAYSFDYVDAQWIRSAKLVAEDGFYSQRFGHCVALRGDRALIGAPNGNSAYLFERGADGVWRQVFKFYNRLDHVGGDSVALGDGLVVIGNQDDFKKGNWSGSVSVFAEQPDGSWGPGIKLTASDGRGFWRFGRAVALRNDTLFVGTGVNAVYVFKRNHSSAPWRETAILKPSDPNISAWFGHALAVSGRTLIVGDPGNSRNDRAYGAAYVFVEHDDGQWHQAGKLIAYDGAPQDSFGYAVAVCGTEAVIGAPDKRGENYREGAAYLYAVGPDDDGDGVMDVCECPGDLDGDRDVDLADLAALLTHWGAPCPK